VLERACTHAGGPYKFKALVIEGYCVYTNNPPAGAFRGFGVTQTCFALESTLNHLAEKAGISPCEFRARNVVSAGDVLANGQVADSGTNIAACVAALKDDCAALEREGKAYGIACSLKNSGVGVGLPDTGRCILSIEDGMIHVRTSAACIGQGIATVLVQIVSQETGVPPQNIIVEPPDTARTPNSGTTTASRQTVITGEAARSAAEKLRAALEETALSSLNGKEFYGEYCTVTDKFGSDKKNPVSHVAYSYAAVLVVLDNEGRLEKIKAVYDIGQVINPLAAEGQVDGGLLMGAGYALTENFPLENCVPRAKYGTLGLLRATDVPAIEVIILPPPTITAPETAPPDKPAYGAKGVGELAAIPVTPAISAAYYKLDGLFRTKLPLEQTRYS
jgi:CO/xanthine dehydrogenase Mo-binding subunit